MACVTPMRPLKVETFGWVPRSPRVTRRLGKHHATPVPFGCQMSPGTYFVLARLLLAKPIARQGRESAREPPSRSSHHAFSDGQQPETSVLRRAIESPPLRLFAATVTARWP
jgi:hypothetical protein